jgi:hypothetical protein
MVQRAAVVKSLMLTVALTALLASGQARAEDAGEKTRLEAFKSQLTRRGLLWNEGLVWFPNIVDLCCACRLPTCYGNNASTTYGFFALPPAPNQDPAVKNPYAEWYTEDGTLSPDWSFEWRLRPDEAVVFLGPTPPKVEYYGFTAYIYDRYVETMGAIPDCVYLAPDGSTVTRAHPASAQNRFPVFASLGDTINPLTVDLKGGRQNPYRKSIAVVMAADLNTKRKVHRSLTAAGFSEDSINFLALPPALVKMGLDSRADSFMIAMRVSPGPNNDVSAYFSASDKSLIRISPAAEVPPADLRPVPPPELRVRGTGKTESSLAAEVDALEKAIVAYYKPLGFTATPVKMATIPDGYNCLANMQNCLGDNRDTIFICPAYDIMNGTILPGQPALTLGPSEFYVAFGVQHPSVKKATYSNISIMGWRYKQAPAVVTNEDMEGSAAEYLPGANPALYAYQIARPGGCLSQHCTAIGTDCSTGIASDEIVAPIFRAYVEPATKVGPAWGEVILDRILKFTGP